MTENITVNQLSIEESLTIIPTVNSLDYTFPTPFNPTTSISFSIPAQSQTLLEVYEINGNQISTLLNQIMNFGHYQIEWNGDSYTGGIYFVKLNIGEFTQTQKLVLVKYSLVI